MDNPHRVHPVESSPYMYQSEQQQQQYPPRYVMLGEDKNDAQGLRPPPYRRNIPRYHSQNPHKKKGGGKCLKCCCCCFCFFFLLILILVAVAALLVYTYNPQIPTYKVDNMDVAALQPKPDFSVYAKFVVTVKADNPNKKISVIYEKDSSVKAAYNGTTICSGHLPSFHQGHENVTLIKVPLDGVSTFGSGLQEVLRDSRQGKRIPLLIEVKAPVTIVMGVLPLKGITVFANISLTVDNLMPGKKVGILSSEYKIKVRVSEQPLLEYKVK